jgi:cytochrome P450
MSIKITSDKSCPVTDWDPFSEEALADPFPSYEELRTHGPVVYLSHYKCWAVLDHTVITDVLNNWQDYSSAFGVGLDNFHKEKGWRAKSIILEVDPPDHDKSRRVLTRVLSRPAMEKMRRDFSAEAEKLISELVAKKTFDGVADLAEVYPLKVFPDAVGLNKQGRENLLLYGNLVFNATYPHNQLFENAFKEAAPVIEWIMSQCSREALTNDGLGAHIYAAVEQGVVNEDEAGMLVRSLLSAGLDTTVNGIGNALYCFARFPDQWQILKNDPSLARTAIDEVLRFEGGVTCFFRTTNKDVELCGTSIPAHEKVLILFTAGDRDPKKWQDPDKFNITRDTKGHLGFGAGVHACVGQMVARLEMELVLAELARQVDHLEITANPARKLNNSLRGLGSLPLRVS